MRFQTAAQITQGVADVDPIANPDQILLDHLMQFKAPTTVNPDKLMLALVGIGAEAVTLTLYFLIEDSDALATVSAEYLQNAARRWLQFDTALTVTNGTIQVATTGLPAGGVIYARVTADTIGASQTRSLLAAWV